MKALRFRNWHLLLLLPAVLITYSTVFTSSRLPGGELSDTLHQGYPFVAYTAEALHAGHLPHWNPLIFCGIPFYSSFSAPVFYPVRGLLLILFGAEASVRFLFPIHLVLSGLFAWIFLGSLGTGRWGRIVGALAYALAAWSNTLFYAGHGSKMICWSLFPLLLYSCERWVTSRRAVFIGLGGLAIGMQALSSHPQMLLYSAGGALVWTVFRGFSADGGPRRNLLPAVAGVSAVMILGIAIGAVQLLPGYNFSKYSSRGADLSPDQASSYSLPPEETLTMAFPRLFGYRHGFDDSTMMGAPLYFGRLGLRLSSEFVGVSVLVLAAAAWFLSDRKTRWPLLTLAILGLLISWGGYTPVFDLLYRTVPLFRKLRAPHMAAFITTAAIALSAGPGFDALFRKGLPASRRFAAGAAIFAGICLMVFLLAGSILPGLQSGWWSRMGAAGGSGFPGYSAVVNHRVDMAAPDFLKAALAAGVIAGLARFGIGPGRWRAALPGAVVVLLIGLELIPVDRDFQVYLDGSGRIEDHFPGQQDVPADPGSGRLMPGGNEYIPMGIRSVSGYHAAKPAVVQDLQDAISSGGVPAMRQTGYTLLQVEGGMLTYAQVREALLQQSAADPETLADIEAALPESPQPRTWLAASWVVVSEQQGFQAMVSGFDFQGTTLLYEDPGIDPAGTDGSEGESSARITVDLPETVVINTDGSSPGILVLADTWYPRWTVEVDGEPAELLRVNHWQRGVAVSAGPHIVAFRFDASDVRTGLFISLAGVAVVILLSAAELLRRRRTGEGHGV
jgi:hypothetical protein